MFQETLQGFILTIDQLDVLHCYVPGTFRGFMFDDPPRGVVHELCSRKPSKDQLDILHHLFRDNSARVMPETHQLGFASPIGNSQRVYAR